MLPLERTVAGSTDGLTMLPSAVKTTATMLWHSPGTASIWRYQITRLSSVDACHGCGLPVVP